MPSSRSRRDDKDAELAGELLGLVLIGTVIVVGLLVVLIVEVARIYRRRALAPGPARDVLRIALGVFCGLLGIAGLLVALDLAVAGLGLAGGSLALFALVVELADRYAARFDRPGPPELGLEEVLAPWPAEGEQEERRAA